MFNTIFIVLAVWFVANFIWMWFHLNDHILQQTLAWLNVYAIIIGFWVYYGFMYDAGVTNIWFITLTWAMVLVAALQFYFGFRQLNNHKMV